MTAPHLTKKKKKNKQKNISKKYLVRNKTNTLQEAPGTHTPNYEYKNIATAHIKHQQYQPCQDLNAEFSWYYLQLKRKEKNKKKHPYLIKATQQMPMCRNLRKSREN